LFTHKTSIAGDEALALRLAKADFTPSVTLTLSQLTEADFPNYSERAFQFDDFSNPIQEGTEYTTVAGGQPYWWQATDGTQNVYGWYLVRRDSDEVLFAEKYDTPVTMTFGVVHSVQVKLKFGACSA
jgi:hypothetical protein